MFVGIGDVLEECGGHHCADASVFFRAGFGRDESCAVFAGAVVDEAAGEFAFAGDACEIDDCGSWFDEVGVDAGCVCGGDDDVGVEFACGELFASVEVDSGSLAFEYGFEWCADAAVGEERDACACDRDMVCVEHVEAGFSGGWQVHRFGKIDVVGGVSEDGVCLASLAVDVFGWAELVDGDVLECGVHRSEEDDAVACVLVFVDVGFCCDVFDGLAACVVWDDVDAEALAGALLLGEVGVCR